MATFFNLQLILASAAFAFANNVPEPASLFLLGSGLAGTAGALRRRYNNRTAAK